MKRKLLLLSLLLISAGCETTSPYIPCWKGEGRNKCVEKAIKAFKSFKKQGFETRMKIGLERKDDCDIEEYEKLRKLIMEGRIKSHCWTEYKNKKTGKWIPVYDY